MKPSELVTVLTAYIKAIVPILITGAPGVGKSEIAEQATALAGAELMISHPAVEDPTDAKGLPFPSKDGLSATFLPFGNLLRALKAKKPLVWFLDDLGQASPAVQAAYMQLLLARQVNGQVLPKHVTFIAATNRRADRAGVSGILEPVKSRFGSIVSLEPNLDEWCQWAVRNSVRPEIIAYLRFHKEALHSFVPTADIVNQPSPRTWKFASDALNMNLSEAGKQVNLKDASGEKVVVNDSLEFQALKGAVGEGAAAGLAGFLRMYRQLPSIDGILADANSAPIPTIPGALYAVSTGLAMRANAQNLPRVIRYGERLCDSGHGEFGVLLVRDFVRRDPDLAHTQAYTNMAFTELGKLIAGEDD